MPGDAGAERTDPDLLDRVALLDARMPDRARRIEMIRRSAALT